MWSPWIDANAMRWLRTTNWHMECAATPSRCEDQNAMSARCKVNRGFHTSAYMAQLAVLKGKAAQRIRLMSVAFIQGPHAHKINIDIEILNHIKLAKHVILKYVQFRQRQMSHDLSWLVMASLCLMNFSRCTRRSLCSNRMFKVSASQDKFAEANYANFDKRPIDQLTLSIFVNCGWSSKGLKIVGSRRGIVTIVRICKNDKKW